MKISFVVFHSRWSVEIKFLDQKLGPLALSSKNSGEMSISPTRLRNPNNTIRVGSATSFTVKLHLDSPKIRAEQ